MEFQRSYLLAVRLYEKNVEIILAKGKADVYPSPVDADGDSSAWAHVVQ